MQVSLDPFEVYGVTFYLTYATGVCAVRPIVNKLNQNLSRGLDSGGS
jgi:hypothetical protein